MEGLKRLRNRGGSERRWWLVVDNGTADLCRDDPGQELTLIVESTVLALTESGLATANPTK